MIGYWILSKLMMSTLMKLGLSGYDVKTTFWCIPMRISPTKSTFFFEENILVALNTHTIKNEPTLDRSGGLRNETKSLINCGFCQITTAALHN